MSRWSDVADWIGPTKNQTPGGITAHRGLILHIQEGSEAGTEAWQRNPASQISSHFLAPKVGRPRQMVDTADKAWTEAAGNPYWLSVEIEGRHGDALTGDQLDGLAAIYAKGVQVHGWPLRSTDTPLDGGTGLTWHGAGGAPFGGHYDCPGTPIVNARPAILAAASAILYPAPEDENMLMQSYEIKTGVGSVTVVGLRMDGYVAKARNLTAHASFKADFGRAKLRCAVHSAASGWSVQELVVDSAQPAAAASLAVPGDCDGISVSREQVDATDTCTVPVALVVEVG